MRLDLSRNWSNQELQESLQPDQKGCLKARNDGTVLDGHHRLAVLRERAIDIHILPRVILVKDT